MHLINSNVFYLLVQAIELLDKMCIVSFRFSCLYDSQE